MDRGLSRKSASGFSAATSLFKNSLGRRINPPYLWREKSADPGLPPGLLMRKRGWPGLSQGMSGTMMTIPDGARLAVFLPAAVP